MHASTFSALLAFKIFNLTAAAAAAATFGLSSIVLRPGCSGFISTDVYNVRRVAILSWE